MSAPEVTNQSTSPKIAEKLELDKHVKEYWYVNQAEVTINGVDDKEEFQLTDVCLALSTTTK